MAAVIHGFHNESMICEVTRRWITMSECLKPQSFFILSLVLLCFKNMLFSISHEFLPWAFLCFRESWLLNLKLFNFASSHVLHFSLKAACISVWCARRNTTLYRASYQTAGYFSLSSSLSLSHSPPPHPSLLPFSSLAFSLTFLDH